MMFWRAAAFSLLETPNQKAFCSSSASWGFSLPLLDLVLSDPLEETAFEVEERDRLLWE